MDGFTMQAWGTLRSKQTTFRRMKRANRTGTRNDRSKVSGGETAFAAASEMDATHRPRQKTPCSATEGSHFALNTENPSKIRQPNFPINSIGPRIRKINRRFQGFGSRVRNMRCRKTRGMATICGKAVATDGLRKRGPGHPAAACGYEPRENDCASTLSRRDIHFGFEFGVGRAYKPNGIIMPAKSEKQRRLMGAALAYKRGENKHPSTEVKHVAESMTERELADMAKKPLSDKKPK